MATNILMKKGPSISYLRPGLGDPLGVTGHRVAGVLVGWLRLRAESSRDYHGVGVASSHFVDALHLASLRKGEQQYKPRSLFSRAICFVLHFLSHTCLVILFVSSTQHICLVTLKYLRECKHLPSYTAIYYIARLSLLLIKNTITEWRSYCIVLSWGRDTRSSRFKEAVPWFLPRRLLCSWSTAPHATVEGKAGHYKSGWWCRACPWGDSGWGTPPSGQTASHTGPPVPGHPLHISTEHQSDCTHTHHHTHTHTHNTAKMRQNVIIVHNCKILHQAKLTIEDEVAKCFSVYTIILGITKKS